MRVQGNGIPERVHMEPYGREPGKVEVRLRENIQKIAQGEGELYEYDEYVLRMTHREGLKEEIERKLSDYLATGRVLEVDENATIVADLQSALAAIYTGVMQ